MGVSVVKKLTVTVTKFVLLRFTNRCLFVILFAIGQLFRAHYCKDVYLRHCLEVHIRDFPENSDPILHTY